MTPSTLWPAIRRQTQHALACGALRPIATIGKTIEDAGVPFLVRQVSSVGRKDEAKKARDAAPSNPFLPCDRNLVVADIGERHILLLNKFNVIDHHLLIVTREFEPQQALLDASDFDALFACLAQIDGLGFYNSGPEAGASQPHKHLQIVPLPLGQPGPALPIEPLLAAARFGTVPGLPFAHEFARLNSTPENALEQYHTLLRPFQPMPYNLLCTRDWMLLVPRSVSHVEDIAVNALGFAGSIFVRDEAQMRNVERLGPMNVLRRAGLAPSP
ncbi:ATP adenylyltransferase [Caballeronia terrestris]|jgi:ATP adenylyltransferase|uniref:ATP adenylyltransferase n=1 Tax=Caballeronia terrestris TaxID=1226301 RepID=A0A158KEF6_9BURK|nr:DUF4922 domain-containing protein [Caballeronia terrestris]SAL79516.1 ATP adenylyltransferase [Caballeronia terrestris]